MKKAMIFAAGLGTRLAPLTDNLPKALVEYNGKSLLWHVTEKLANEGFDSVTINVHHFADKMKNYVSKGDFNSYIKSQGLQVSISDETEALLDTGGGLKKASAKLFDNDNDPVLIHNVDIVSNAQLNNVYEQIGSADALLLVSNRQTKRYLLFNKEMRLVGWQNIETGEIRSPYNNLDLSECLRLAFSGIHVVSKKLTDAMTSWPDKFSITDFYINMCQNLDIRGHVQNGLELTDIGKIDVFQKLQQEKTL